MTVDAITESAALMLANIISKTKLISSECESARGRFLGMMVDEQQKVSYI